LARQFCNSVPITRTTSESNASSKRGSTADCGRKLRRSRSLPIVGSSQCTDGVIQHGKRLDGQRGSKPPVLLRRRSSFRNGGSKYQRQPKDHDAIEPLSPLIRGISDTMSLSPVLRGSTATSGSGAAGGGGRTGRRGCFADEIGCELEEVSAEPCTLVVT
jgi:hypothetical protein